VKQKKAEYQEIEKLKKTLLEKRETIIGGVRQIDMSSQEMGQDGIQDTADEASTLYNKQVLLSLNENQRKMLREIDDALDRIEEGTYGMCDSCERPISLKRLQIQPFAKYCVQCQHVIEKKTGYTSGE